jgi:REP element-mobilizing transposase RayT
MPRKARIDAPGALHHIICRGIENTKIFRDDTDRDSFVERLGRVISETHTPCYAWALIPNHFHLLLKTDNVPIATVMRRLLTGYAVTFNRRHRRIGHLFQNRYKSILCQEDSYLLELVRYIHLNPLRAKLVTSMRQLDWYQYCGHGVLLGKNKNDWQDASYVLKLFGKRISSSRRHYRQFAEKGVLMGRRPDLIGGGLIRSVGGWEALKAFGRQKIHVKGDERILGDSDFVESVIEEKNERLARRYQLQARGVDFDKVTDRVAKILRLKPEQVLNSGKQPQQVKARSLLCFWAVKELEMSGTEVAQKLKVGNSAVSRSVVRGEKIVADMKLKLVID